MFIDGNTLSFVNDESGWEEGKETVVLVTLHDCKSCDLVRMDSTSEEVSILSVLANNVRCKSWSEPLDNKSMVFSFNINHVNFVREEVTMTNCREFFWLFSVASDQVNLHFVFTELDQQAINFLSLGVSEDIHVLRWNSSLGVKSEDWVEAIEERLEVNIFSVLNDS
jgi:hypothetical protein